MECYNFTATYKKVPAADADIAGIGVLLSFLISAWSAFALTAFSYIWGFIPESLLSDFDVRFLRVRQKASKEWTKTFQKAVLIFSDQQIVTGIAILIAGFGQFDKISVYHWQIVVYQAWMSSNVHLTSLTMLRSFLKTSPALRAWRITGMIVLLGLLLAALAPTVSGEWNGFVWNDSYVTSDAEDQKNYWIMGLPARCFLNSTALGSSEFIYPPDRSYPIDNAWRFGYFKTINVDAIFSYIFICGAYIWKIAALFEASHILFLRWTVKLPMQFMQRRLCRLAKRQGSESRSTATVCKYHSKTETSGVLEAEQESLTRRSTDGSPNPMHSRDLAQVPDILEDEEATALKAQQEPLVAELDFQDEKTLEKTLEDLHLMLYKTRTMRWLRGSTLIATTAIISTVVGILIQTRGRNITSAIGYYVAPPLGLVLLVSMGSLVLDRELYR
ncbi:hypothetical protein Tdes44962_MAKER04592 [Teratosphaeria destructans]|uniref:Uncharacterized protein n=1 Tax=Teratosphaeria destructans TaxID=418781 RepID=A0A9W7VZY3_9PEZI|nr:hypothetical protein Tdes44962_MAKER04592 [Teratosphaeria destructans]